jgi:glucose dehydrogenase
VDLFSGKKVWDVPLGSFIPGMNTGAITLGGPMATAGVLVFTVDNYLRALSILRQARNSGNLSCQPVARLPR